MKEAVIDFVKENPFLYDKSHKSYKNVYLRDKKFQELATELNEPVKSIKARWRSLRDGYFRNKKAPPSGSAATKKPWKWADAMSFLSDVDNANSNTTCNYDLDDTFILEDCNASTCPEVATPAPKKRKFSNSSMDETNKQLSEVLNVAKGALEQPQKVKTAADLFFDSVAVQVNDLNLSGADLSMLQIDVLQSIHKYRK